MSDFTGFFSRNSLENDWLLILDSNETSQRAIEARLQHGILTQPSREHLKRSEIFSKTAVQWRLRELQTLAWFGGGQSISICREVG